MDERKKKGVYVPYHIASSVLWFQYRVTRAPLVSAVFIVLTSIRCMYFILQDVRIVHEWHLRFYWWEAANWKCVCVTEMKWWATVRQSEGELTLGRRRGWWTHRQTEWERKCGRRIDKQNKRVDERQPEPMEINLKHNNNYLLSPFFTFISISLSSIFSTLSLSLSLFLFLSLSFSLSLSLSVFLSLNFMVCPDSQALRWS